MDILQKYKPKMFTETIGNRLQIQKIKTLYNIFKPILLLGPPGSGKTMIIDIWCSVYNFASLHVNKDTLHQVKHFIYGNDITSLFDKKHKCIIFDNIDTLVYIDKVSVSFLIETALYCSNHKIHCIMCCNSNDDKKITDLKKHTEVIHLSYPSPKDAFTYIMRLFDNEEINYDSEKLLKYCQSFDGNIREIIEQYMSGDKYHTITQFRNMNMFETIQHFYNDITLSKVDIRFLLDDDPVVRSSMLFENIPEELHLYRFPKDFQTSKFIYTSIVRYYTISTLLEKYMYKNHEWFLWDIAYLLRFMGMRYALQSSDKTRIDTKSKQVLRYSQLLSKSSHKQILHKRIKVSYEGISYESKLLMAYHASITKTEKERKRELTIDECNFVNTYDKYFSQ